MYNCINDVIVLKEFAKPAFCIKTNEGLLVSNIPAAIPIASSSLEVIKIFFFSRPLLIKIFNVESGTPIKFSIPNFVNNQTFVVDMIPSIDVT